MSTGDPLSLIEDLAGSLWETFKCLDSGGSITAKLKLKEIDGRAPPGVEPAA